MKNSAIDVTSIPFINAAKYHKFEEERAKGKDKHECVWSLDNIHDGEVAVASMFEGYLKIPICSSHYSWHCAIITLVLVGGLDVDVVIAMSREVCMSELATRGLMPIKV